MTSVDVPVTRNRLSSSSGNFSLADTLSACVHKGLLAHTHYVIPSGHSNASSFRLELKETAEQCKPDFNKSKAQLAITPDDFPYGLTESQWWEYALSPHSYLALENGCYQIGLNYSNRFLHLDTHRARAHVLDPGVGNEFLSTTNWFDPEEGCLWFASWPIQDMLMRHFNPLDNVRVTIWNFSLASSEKKQIWQGNLGDSLHQLALTPDKRFLVLAELGLRPRKPADTEHADEKQILAPSTVLVLDLQTNREWRLEMPSAAHVEFDPEDPSVCYLSGHNIGLIGPKVGIFGSAIINKVRLTPTGPQVIAGFTHPDFYRITTHLVFSRRGKTLIAVSGYPGQVFLIDASTMQLHRIIDMDIKDKVDTSDAPHLCRKDSYGIAASANGQHLLICATGLLRVADIDTGQFVLTEKIKGYQENSCFTGHLGRFRNASGMTA